MELLYIYHYNRYDTEFQDDLLETEIFLNGKRVVSLTPEETDDVIYGMVTLLDFMYSNNYLKEKTLTRSSKQVADI